MKSILLSVRKYFCSIILLAHVSMMFAQSSDWGLWTSIDAEKKLSKKWELDVAAQYRMNDHISVTDQIRGSVDVSRKTGKFVKLGFGYELIAKNKVKQDMYVYRNRFRVQATGSYKYARFTASWRTRIQLTLLENNNKPDVDNQKWVWRNRFGLKYDIKKTPLKPYINFELFHQLFSDLEYSYYQNRFSTGIEYSLNKRNTIEAGYKLETEAIGAYKNKLNVVNLGYIYSF